jgi:Holliday junction DNA helicase RuvA
VLALKILSGMSVDDLVPAVRAGDLARLTRIPGVGRKTAERMIVELRDKLAAMEAPEGARPPAAPTGIAGDVVSALLNLGYEPRAAEQAVERAGKNGAADSFEALLRGALQELTAPAQASARSAR